MTHKIPLHLKGDLNSVENATKRAEHWTIMAQLVPLGRGGFRVRQARGNTRLEDILILAGTIKTDPRAQVFSERGNRKRAARAAFIKRCKEEGNPSRAWKRPPTK